MNYPVLYLPYCKCCFLADGILSECPYSLHLSIHDFVVYFINIYGSWKVTKLDGYGRGSLQKTLFYISWFFSSLQLG